MRVPLGTLLSLTVLLVTLLPARAPAQEPLRDSLVTDESFQAHAEALDRVRERLTPLLRQLMETPALHDRREAYEARMRDAVDEILPAAPRHRARLAELAADYDRALRTGDEIDFDAMLREGITLERSLRAARIEASERPALARMARELEELAMARLAELDPDATRLLELEERLVWAMWGRVLEAR